MAGFNPTKAQRKMVKFILRQLQEAKTNTYNSKEIHSSHALGAAVMMYTLAESSREVAVAERVYNLALDVKYKTVRNLPNWECIKLREERKARIKRALERSKRATARNQAYF